MILPIGDDQVKGGHWPIFSYGFILLNIAVFVFESNLSEGQLAVFFTQYGSIPEEILRGEDLHTLITSMFIHGSLLHLLGNMLFLWIFADNIEATVGNFRFLIFYLFGGAAAAAGHSVVDANSTIPMVGASGAISAVMGAYMVMYPTSRIRTLIVILPIRVSAWLFLGFWIWQQWNFGTSSLADGNPEGVAWWAHIAGFAAGILGGVVFRARGLLAGKSLHQDE